MLLVLIFAAPSFAATGSNALLAAQGTATGATTGGNLKTQVTDTRVTSLQQRAQTEITRRINFLNDLSTKIDEINKISDADKTTLKTQMQQQIDGLTTLLTKIQSDTDLTTLRTDVKSVINGYYIFAFFRVKISLMFAADRLSSVTNDISIVYNKLADRISAEKSQGINVVSSETLLSDMLTKIKAANTDYQDAQTQLSGLAAQDYPGNKSSLFSARTKLKAGALDITKAYQDAVKIRQGLSDSTGNINFKSSTTSAVKSTK